MFDHISNAIKNVVVVIVCLPHEGRGTDHFVLLIYIGFVKKEGLRSKQEKAFGKMSIKLSNI